MSGAFVEYLWFHDGDPWWATLLRSVAMIVIGAIIVIKGANKVPFKHRGVRSRFNIVIRYRKDQVVKRDGRLVQVRRGDVREYGPLVYFGIPFVHNMHCESVQRRFLDLPLIIRPDPLQEVAAQIFFRVVNLEQAIVENENFTGGLVSACAAVVKRLIAEGISDDELSAQLLTDNKLQVEAALLGVELLELKVATANMTPPAQLARALKLEGALLDPALAATLTAQLVALSRTDTALAPVQSQRRRWLPRRFWTKAA